MDWTNLTEWLDLVVRWFHVMAAITWVGSSFYFLWLGRVFASPERTRAGDSGEPWMIHATGFALSDKFRPGPGEAMKMLHWFKRESVLVWASGVVLLYLVYFVSGGAFLTARVESKAELWAYAAASAALIVLAWMAYDWLWNSALGQRPVRAGVVSFLLVLFVAWGLSRVVSGRAVYVFTGSILGTLMVGNVWLRMLPALRERTEASETGRVHDAAGWSRAQLRSVHNSYLAFPVATLMLSIHHPGVHGGPYNIAVLALLLAGFVAARHVVVNGRGRRWALAAVVAALAGMISLTGSVPARIAPGTGVPVAFAAVRAVINERCIACHSLAPADRSFGVAPGGVNFDAPEDIRRFALRIRQRIVIAETMPFGNHPRPTVQERELLGRWVEQGASLQ